MKRYAAVWGCALLVLAACAESKTVPRTQITLVVRAVPAVEQDAARVTIKFRTGEGRDELADVETNERFGNGRDPDSIEWPISLALIRSSQASVFEVQVEALDAAGDVIARRVVQSGFAPNQTKLLELLLERLSSACLLADCSASQNCSEQGGDAVCEDPPFLDPDDLPDFTGGEDGGTPGGDPCGSARAPDCGEHGRCVAEAGEATCECDPEYAGPTCSICADGYVLVEGVCAEICAEADMDACQPGEICRIDASGDPSCVAVCSGGMLPDAAGDCVPICESVIAPDCGEHGACMAATMPPSCVCDAGYAGDDCSDCDTGHGDDGAGGCVDLCSATSAPDCGANGSCMVEGNDALCNCTFPYTGTLCTDCSEGYVLNGDVCEPDCGVCAAHEFCDATPTVPECACVIGYDVVAAVDPPMCAWQGGGVNGGGLIDEVFADATAWTTNLATFDPDFFGQGDGLVEFERIGLCRRASVSQTFDMPAIETAEPLAFVIEYFGNNTDPFGCNSETVLVVGGVPQPVQMPNQDGIARVCLGANAYGPGVELTLAAEIELGCPANTYCTPRSYGGISIEPAMAGECGLPGHFGNADFATLGVDGWTVNFFLRPTVGAGGSMVLGADYGCGAPYAENSISVPPASELPNPAIRFTARYDLGPHGPMVTNSGFVEIGIDGEYAMLQRTPLALGVDTTITTCLPSFTAGSARKLRIASHSPSYTCPQPDGASYYDLTISSLELISDPDCAPGAPDLMLDIPAAKTPWQVIVGGNGHGTAQIVEGPGVGHSGDRVIQIQTGTMTACVSNYGATRVLIPPPIGERRPVLRFWNKLDVAGGPNYTSRPFGGDFTPSTPDWGQREVCIDPAFGGELVNLTFEAGCNNDGVQHNFLIDDVELSNCANPGACTASGTCP